MEQRSDEWFSARLGCVTASKVSDIMAKTKTGDGASRKNYMMQLLCERLTGQKEDFFVNAAMQRGTDLEPFARAVYEMKKDVSVVEEGFVLHPTIKGFGASPDGLVGDNGLIEIKCPNTATHINTLLTKKIDKKYQLQMLAQMACTGRKWCDFVSYDDRLPDNLQLVIIPFDLTQKGVLELYDSMIDEVFSFISQLDLMEIELRLK